MIKEKCQHENWFKDVTIDKPYEVCKDCGETLNQWDQDHLRAAGFRALREARERTKECLRILARLMPRSS